MRLTLLVLAFAFTACGPLPLHDWATPDADGGWPGFDPWPTPTDAPQFSTPPPRTLMAEPQCRKAPLIPWADLDPSRW